MHDIQTGTVLAENERHLWAVESVGFSSDGRSMWTIDRSGVAQIYDLAEFVTGKPYLSYDSDKDYYRLDAKLVLRSTGVFKGNKPDCKVSEYYMKELFHSFLFSKIKGISMDKDHHIYAVSDEGTLIKLDQHGRVLNFAP